MLKSRLFILLLLGLSITSRAAVTPSSLTEEELSRAREHLSEDSGDAARAVFEDLLQESIPEEATPVTLRSYLDGIEALRHGENAQAIASLIPVVDAAPRWHSAWQHLLEAYRRMEDWKTFLKTSDRYFTTFSSDPEVRLYCGRVWMQLGAWGRVGPLRDTFRDEATKDLPPRDATQAVEAQPFVTLLHLDRALRDDPENPRLLQSLGDLLSHYQNHVEALRVYEHWARLEPDNLRAIVSIVRQTRALGSVERGKKAIARAEALLDQHKTLSPRARASLETELSNHLVYFLDRQDSSEFE